MAFSEYNIAGYILALVAAFVWSSYSVLCRRMSGVPTEAVAGFCIATAILATLCTKVFETPVWPSSNGQWLAIALLGLGPVGAAFFLWDIGMKKGDIRFLGVAAYAAPVISTIALIASGAASPTRGLIAGCIMIVAGAFLARR